MLLLDSILLSQREHPRPSLNLANKTSTVSANEHAIGMTHSLMTSTDDNFLVPPYTATLTPSALAAASQLANTANPGEDFRYNDSNFSQSTLQSCGCAPNSGPDQPSTAEYEQDNPLWGTFDLGDLDWCLHGSLLLESAEACSGVLTPMHGSSDPESGSAETTTRTYSAATLVARSWYTNLDCGSNTGGSSSDIQISGATGSDNGNGSRMELNEVYRESLSSRLHPRWAEEPLPSTDFLRMCIHMYFSRVNPAFPILHAPTFRPTSDNGSLILSICSVGSLFLGTSEAAHYGSSLFERLLQAMMVSWATTQERYVAERVPMVQLALLGQMFGLLSGKPRHLAIVSAFHGTVISWARRAELFKIDENPLNLQDVSGLDLVEVWRDWSRKEEMRRAALAIFVQDAEITALFHHEPFLRHRSKCVPLACGSDAFLATNAQNWARLIRDESSTASKVTRCHHLGAARPPLLTSHSSTAACCRSVFTAYAILEGIGASIFEDRLGNQHDHASGEKHAADLITWHRIYIEMIRAESDPQCLIILWHWTCMSNYVDLNRLELAIGKQGPVDASTHIGYIHQWSSSVDSKRCLMHAYLLQKSFEDIALRRVAAIHVPRCLFSAAIVWSTYLNSLTSFPPSLAPPEDLTFPELRMLGTDFLHQWQDMIGFRKGNLCAIKTMTLCSLTDMLRQMTYWEISRKFNEILTPLIHGGTDDSMIQR